MPLPPYGRKVLERINRTEFPGFGGSPDGRCAQFVVAIGPGAMMWPLRNPQVLCVAVAPGEDPIDYRFDWAARHAPALIMPVPRADIELVHRTAVALIRDGAPYAIAALANGWIRLERGRPAA